jgi:hypothetical protein
MAITPFFIEAWAVINSGRVKGMKAIMVRPALADIPA